MKAEYLNPFPLSVIQVLKRLGVTGVKKTSLKLQEDMTIEKDVTAFVGLVGELQGNVSYCFSQQTAKRLASVMMSTKVESLDSISLSALAELANMFTAHAVTLLQNTVQGLDITTPSVVSGREMFFILTFHDTLTVSINTSIGPIEVNIGLEI